MTAQLALLEPARPAPTRVRRLAGLLRFDNEPLAEAWLERHGRIWCIERGVTLTIRPRLVGGEYLLVAWRSGHCWALTAGKRLQRMRAADVR